jgi:predicted Zn-dependent protease
MRNMIKLIGVIFIGYVVLNFIKDNDGIKTTLNLKEMTDGDTIHIHGLGKHSVNSLVMVKNIIEEYHHLPVVIDEPVEVLDEYRMDDNSINMDDFMSDYDSDENSVYISNEIGYSEENDNFLEGYAEKFGNIVTVFNFKPKTIKHIIIHEFAHNEGLSHCDNPKCIMYHKVSDNNLNDEFCENCRKY